MDFEIEDDDDPYDFQSNWSKPSKEKSGFGFGYDAGGGGGGDDDAYNYDFGVIKEETSHYSGNQLSSKSSNKKTSPAKTKPKAVTGGNAMEKAAAMLDRYSGKPSSTKTSNTFKSSTLDFDEDDISISMGSEESYEDPYSGKGSKKNSLHQKSVLEGGLDSDIPHIKQDRIDKTVPTFQETAENGKSGVYLEEDDDYDDVDENDFILEASMEESLDDFNHKIDAGKSLYNSNKPEEESMGDYSKDDFDDIDEAKNESIVQVQYKHNTLQGHTELVKSVDDDEEESLPDEDSEVVDSGHNNRGSLGNVMAFNFADLGLTDAVSEKYEEDEEESLEGSNEYGASFEDDVDVVDKNEESVVDKDFEEQGSLGMTKSTTTTNLLSQETLTDIPVNKTNVDVTEETDVINSAKVENTSSRELRAIVEESTCAYESKLGNSVQVNHVHSSSTPLQSANSRMESSFKPNEELSQTSSTPLQPQLDVPVCQAALPQVNPPQPSQQQQQQLYQVPVQQSFNQQPQSQFHPPPPAQQSQQQQQQQPAPFMYHPPQPQPSQFQQAPIYPPYPNQQFLQPTYMIPPPVQPIYPPPPTYSMYPPYAPPPYGTMYAMGNYAPPTPHSSFNFSANPSSFPFFPPESVNKENHLSNHREESNEEKGVDRALVEMAKELRIAKEEATYATQKLADVIMDLHRSKESQKHSKQDSPKRQAKSPHKTSSLRSLKSSPITKKSRNKPPSFQNSDSLQEEVGEDDDSYDEDDFDEESHLNISVGPLSVPKGEHDSNKQSKLIEQEKVEEEDEEDVEHTLHPPRSTSRDSSEFLRSSKRSQNRSVRYDYDEEQLSTANAKAEYFTSRQSSFANSFPERESFDGVLRASQKLFQRQLATIKDRLEGINSSSTNDMVSSLNLPSYTARQSWAAPRGNVSSSLSDVKEEFQSQRHVRQDKLKKALLAVDPTLSQEDLVGLMAKYS